MKRSIFAICLVLLALGACKKQAEPAPEARPGDSVVYELNVRQLTPEGTFAAAEAHLPLLRELGVDIIWVMPPYPIGEKGRKGSLGSYYAIRDYCDINPEFGTLEDFDHFLAEAHAQGFMVILDWVANHTAPDHPWVTEKPADWYVRDADGNTIVEYDWTDIAKLNYDNADMRSEMEKSMRFWLERGVDGFRCDVAYQVPQDFWAAVLPAFRKEFDRPLYFLAEGEEAWLHDAGFDATYAWRLHHLLNDIAQGKANADSLVQYMLWNQENYKSGARRLCFTSNHDENSWSGTEFERMGDAWKAMTVLCWTLPQAQPLIYTGQEFGYDHRFAFFDKDPLPARKTNAVTDFYRELAQLREDHPAMIPGKGTFELLSSDDNTLRIRRTAGDDIVYVTVQLEAPWAWDIETSADVLTHLEPPCWWVGMETPLQLLVQAPEINAFTVRLEGQSGVRLGKVHKTQSPDYLFIDVQIDKNAKPGTFQLVFSREGNSFRVPYKLLAREEGSAERGSFGSSDAVYLIMPDRFVNGDPTNDETADTMENPDYAAFFGRHGGDIQGIEDQLDYIADLGFTAIWSTPLLEDNEPESSYHGYACTDYYKIDSRFGSNWKYRELVQEAHKRGIKVIMDVVTNHCGDQHWWMQDLPSANWVHLWPEYTHSNCSFSVWNDPYCSDLDRDNMVAGWFDTSMVDMNLDNPYVLHYFQQWAAWWAEWAGLDGFRVDTYPYNEKGPMSEWCASVRKEYPHLNIVGEVWSVNVPQVAYWQADNPNPDGFNSHLPSIMDFSLQSAICQGINTDHENWDEGITRWYDSIANDAYIHDPWNMMVFAGNHDTDRIGDVVGKDPAKMKLIMALLSTVRGYPQVFAGDELMVVSRDRSQGHGGLRVEFPQDWEQNPVQKDLHDYLRKLLRWRRDNPNFFRWSNIRHFLTRDNTYAYFRYVPYSNGEDAVFVYLNNNPEPREIPWKDYEEVTRHIDTTEGYDVITGEKVDLSPRTVPGRSALVVHFPRNPKSIVN